MRGSLSRKVALTSVLLVAVVASAFAVTVLEVVALHQSLRDETRATRARIAADAVMKDVLDLETGQRGYVITHDPQFLQPWRSASRALPADSRALERAAAGDPTEASTSAELVRRAEAYRVAGATHTLGASRGGKKRVDAIRRVFAQLGASVDALSHRRERAAHDDLLAAITAGASGLGVSLVLILVSALYLWRRALAPVRRVAAAAARFGRGELDVRLPVTGTGEIGQLKAAFNSMADAVVSGREELTRHAEELEHANTVSRAVLDSTVDGIALTDLQGTILLANAPLARYVAELGIPTHGTIYERLMAIAPRFEDPERYAGAMRRIAANPAARTSDEFRLTDIGRSFRGFTAPVRDSAGGFVGRIFTLRETTAERESERLKDEFVATVSHELRTPLTSILGYLELVLDEDLPEEHRSHLEVVNRNARRLLRVVGDLLFVAQVESRALHLEREAVDPAAVAAQSVETARPAAADAGVELVLDAPPLGLVEADGTRLTQLLDNLVSNAIKFTPAGGRVTVRVREEQDRLVLSVADTGAGIPAEEQPQLFDRFFRSSSAHRLAVPGTGLGLAIVQAIAAAHDGHVAVWSEPGRGTIFTVTLPLRRPQPAFERSHSAAVS